jgi:hypothetical protein
MGSVSEFLVVYLDSIDERLLDYLDEEDELQARGGQAPEVLRERSPRGLHQSRRGGRGLGGLVRPHRGPVAAYAPEEIGELEEAAPLMSDEVEKDIVLTEADRVYLVAVELLLDAYPEMRLGE